MTEFFASDNEPVDGEGSAPGNLLDLAAIFLTLLGLIAAATTALLNGGVPMLMVAGAVVLLGLLLSAAAASRPPRSFAVFGLVGSAVSIALLAMAVAQHPGFSVPSRASETAANVLPNTDRAQPAAADTDPLDRTGRAAEPVPSGDAVRIVVVMADGRFAVEGAALDDQAMRADLRSWASRDPRTRIRVDFAKETPADRIIALYELCAAAGIKNVKYGNPVPTSQPSRSAGLLP